jgi:hypothetical protein
MMMREMEVRGEGIYGRGEEEGMIRREGGGKLRGERLG